jgi:hypothetical protein
MSFEIDIEGIQPLLKALAAYPDIAAPIVEQASDVALLSLIPGLANYPAPPTGSAYRRTGTLGRLWSAAQSEWQTIPSGFEASIGNATPYGEWVQGATTQAAIHAGRWSTDQQIVDDHALETEHIYEQALQQIADAIDQKAGG